MAATVPQTFDFVHELKEADICNRALARIGADRIRDTIENTKQANACRAVYSLTRDELIRMYPWNFATRIDLILEDTSYAYETSGDGNEIAYTADGREALTSDPSTSGGVTIPNITVPSILDGTYIGRRVVGTNVRPNTTIIGYNNTLHTLTIDRGTASYSSGVYTPAAGSAFKVVIPIMKILQVDYDSGATFVTSGGDDEKRIITSRVTGTTLISAVTTSVLAMKYLRQVIDPNQFDPVFLDALVLRIASKIALTMTRQSGILQAIEGEFSAVMQAAKFTASEERQTEESGEWFTDRRAGSGPSSRTI